MVHMQMMLLVLFMAFAIHLHAKPVSRVEVEPYYPDFYAQGPRFVPDVDFERNFGDIIKKWKKVASSRKSAMAKRNFGSGYMHHRLATAGQSRQQNLGSFGNQFHNIFAG